MALRCLSGDVQSHIRGSKVCWLVVSGGVSEDSGHFQPPGSPPSRTVIHNTGSENTKTSGMSWPNRSFCLDSHWPLHGTNFSLSQVTCAKKKKKKPHEDVFPGEKKRGREIQLSLPEIGPFKTERANDTGASGPVDAQTKKRGGPKTGHSETGFLALAGFGIQVIKGVWSREIEHC